MKVTVTVPEEYMGDVIGDLNSRRGQIQRYGVPHPALSRSMRLFRCLRCSVTPPICVRKTQGRGQLRHGTRTAMWKCPRSIAEKIISERTKNRLIKFCGTA